MPSSTAILPRIARRDIIEMAVGVCSYEVVDLILVEGRILGLSEGLRVVHSKERTQRGLELAPLGRPYVKRFYLVRDSRALMLCAYRFPGIPPDHLKVVLPSILGVS